MTLKKFKAKKQTKKRRIGRRILLCICIYLLYMLLGSTVYHLHHKTVNEETAAEIDNTSYTSDTVGTEKVLCIDDNDDAMYWRLRLINEAESEIIYSCFEVHDDAATYDVFSALYAAAERGVKVKLLFDGIFTGKNIIFSPVFKALAHHENVTLRLYNIPNLIEPWLYSFRMHDKYVICDKKVYLLGGRNTFDKFLGSYSLDRNIDREMLVIETGDITGTSSVNQLLNYFDDIWDTAEELHIGYNTRLMKLTAESMINRAAELPEDYPIAYADIDIDDLLISTNKITLLHNSTDVKNKEPIIMYTLYKLMKESDKTVIQTPYIIMDDWMYEELEEAAKDSDISIIINSIETGANYFGCGDYLFEKKRLQALPIDWYELVADSSHTKAYLFDERLCVVGSFNYDMRSSYLDTELLLAIDSEELYDTLSETISDQEDMSRHIDKEGNLTYGSNYTEKNMSLFRRCVLYVCGIIGRLLRHLF